MNQHTIKRRISIEDIGLHFGDNVKMTLSPEDEDKGITFYLSSETSKKIFTLSVDNVFDTMLATKLGEKSCFVSTIEHLLAVLHALYITNLKITIVGNEVPILEGSAESLYHLILSAGIKIQKEINPFKIKKKIKFKRDDSFVLALPFDRFKLTYILEKNDQIIGKEIFTLNSLNSFYEDISKARTYGNFDDLEKMKNMGLIKGGNLDNAVVYKNNVILNKDGLRYKNEFVRHKMLDFIGDIYCLGPVLGHFIVKNSGHKLNNEFCKFLISEK